MGIYIKGIEMPEKCYECVCYDPEFNECNVLTDCRGNGRYARVIDREALPPADCPLVPIPHPHGRLIDTDKMGESIRRQTGLFKLMGGGLSDLAETLEKGFLQEIDNAPTVIPAEEGK